MRHVTDGELHAFLDGGLDLLSGDRGGEVRDHLAECPVCRERLQDEDTIRARATEILRDPGLGKLSLPTFEELRERASAPAPEPSAPPVPAKKEVRYRGPLRGLPMAWAATIVLALGVGWMGGQLWRTLPQPRPAAEYAPIEPSGAQLADLDAESPAVGLRESLQENEGSLPTSPVVETVRQGRADETGSVTEPAAAPPPEQRVVEAARREEPARGGVEVESAFRIPRGMASPTSSADASVLHDSVAAKVGLRMTALGLQKTPQAPGAEPPYSLANSFAVPGLKLVSVEWEERITGERALLIRQLLSPGDTLELRYVGLLMGTDPRAGGGGEGGLPLEEASGRRAYANVLEASLPPGWNQVVMDRGRALLVARGPLSEANLKALLKTLH